MPRTTPIGGDAMSTANQIQFADATSLMMACTHATMHASDDAIQSFARASPTMLSGMA